MHQLSDQKLIRLLQQGDRSAFRVLYDRYWEMLFDAAYNMIRQEDASKDIVQEIFMQLWQKRESSIAHPKAYLLQAVKYQSYRHVKKVKMLGELLSSHLESLSYNETEERILFEELNGSLKEIIKQLPGRCQQIFCMSRFEHLSNREIAEKLDIKVKTVENQINKALHLIRHALATLLVLLMIHL